jgi:hypothetical protein
MSLKIIILTEVKGSGTQIVPARVPTLLGSVLLYIGAILGRGYARPLEQSL